MSLHSAPRQNPGNIARISVVVPCYQSAATIGRAIMSVAQQRVPAFEVIAVNDGSNDGTIEVLRSLKGSFSDGCLRIVDLGQNQGPSFARNVGWNAASGDYVAFLDADDAWHPGKLEIQGRFMLEHPEVALSGHLFKLGGEAAEINSQPIAIPVSAWQLLWRNRFVTPSVMLRRELPFRFRVGQHHMEDHRLWLEIAFAGLRVMRLEAELAVLFKPAFKISGQSANLVAMEKAELGNYRCLWRQGRIILPLYVALCIWSTAKFVRRALIVALRRR